MKNKTFTVLIVILIFGWSHTLFAKSENVVSQVMLAAGEFVMGDTYCSDEQSNSDWCSDESPHKVRLDDFLIDTHEVTNSDYQKCFSAGECGPNALHEDRPQEFNRPDQPVVFVTWEDASSYCQWRGGRLPFEAEWEYAAQGDNPGGAYFGKKYKQGAPQKVGERTPNSNGLYDMMGNVNEWIWDWYGELETEGVSANPKGPESGKDKVVRGGSWNSPSHYLRASDRVFRSPELRYSDVGFRCVTPSSVKG
jgi:sulfatase modifying factor 1